ncbi:dihydrodipicolinate synthase family protein [Georgenia sp. TF02-10]|uniref:dihydrodipicolinate synthase family protein n=1 Tax=Georgenia sp. TF02-10 TaxID=2917725 RepID=UPI001FA6DD97|nr:dihydrodipicolinate synthase family protein [Georgenia sp. TF02-10]UNX54298.1 dihydrodipicolinate synthase family protein [Georgenia sp. TF02-10]
MSPRTHPIEGVIPILVTPFRPDGAIDHDGVLAEVDHLLGTGITWVGLGFGSEVDTMSEQEVGELTASVREALGDRGSLIGNVEMAEHHAETCRRIQAMVQAGADAVLLRPIRLDDASEGRQFEMISAAARDCTIDVVVQDAPQHNGVDLTPATLARLLTEVAGVAAVKVEPAAAAVKIGQVRAALAGAPGSIIGGRGGSDLVHELLRGGTGTMPGAAFPELFGQVLAGVASGDVEAALQSWARLLPFAAVGNRDFTTFLWLNKHVLVRQGVLQRTDVRHHGPVDAELRREVDRLLDVFGGGVA